MTGEPLERSEQRYGIWYMFKGFPWLQKRQGRVELAVGKPLGAARGEVVTVQTRLSEAEGRHWDSGQVLKVALIVLFSVA